MHYNCSEQNLCNLYIFRLLYTQPIIIYNIFMVLLEIIYMCILYNNAVLEIQQYKNYETGIK